MTLEEIKLLEHIEVIENEYNIIIIPEPFYYIEVEDIPVNQIYHDGVEMMKQSEYSKILVKCFETEQSVAVIDSSVDDASVIDASL